MGTYFTTRPPPHPRQLPVLIPFHHFLFSSKQKVSYYRWTKSKCIKQDLPSTFLKDNPSLSLKYSVPLVNCLILYEVLCSLAEISEKGKMIIFRSVYKNLSVKPWLPFKQRLAYTKVELWVMGKRLFGIFLG